MLPIKVGIIGYGNSAVNFHLPYILPNKDFELHAFLQRRGPPPEGSAVGPGVHCTIDHPNVKYYQRAEDFFADQDIELVVCCTSTNTHVELVEQTLLANKNVLVEKTFTITSSEADKLIALSRERGLKLCVYHNRRYDSDFRTVRYLINSGALGRVTEYEARYDMDGLQALPWDSPGPGDGMLYLLGGHTLDQALHLFGLPCSVTAFTRSLRPACRADDAFTLILQYAGGGHDQLICTIKTTVVSRGTTDKRLKYIVRGTEGTFVKTGEDVQTEHLLAGLKANDRNFGVEPEAYHGYLQSSNANGLKDVVAVSDQKAFDGSFPSLPGGYMDFYKDLAAAIRGEGKLPIDPQESRNVVRLIELAKASAEGGLTVPWS